jgi:hypothetical protein
MGYNFSLFNFSQPLSAERDKAGNWFYSLFSSKDNFKNAISEKDKLDLVLRNPATLKVFKLNCDLFSLGKVYSAKDGKLLEPNILKQLQPKPNKHQTWNQFKWDYMFYSMLGTAYLWRSNNTNLQSSETKFYWLNPSRMEFSKQLLEKLDKMTLSQSSYNELERETIKYCFEDGTRLTIPLSQITPFFDLSNSVSGNWYKGNSAIDALYKVIANNNETLTAQNINLRYSSKFGVTGQQDPNNTSQLPMSETEKQDIESKVNGSKSVHAFKSKVDINRFVSDIANLKLDEQYLHQYFVIGSMYGIPRDVLEANISGGSTYENQEKATGKHISYALQPKGDDLFEWFSNFTGVEMKITWKHLPFMQVFERDRAEVNKMKAETLKILIESGIDPKEALLISNIKSDE